MCEALTYCSSTSKLQKSRYCMLPFRRRCGMHTCAWKHVDVDDSRCPQAEMLMVVVSGSRDPGNCYLLCASTYFLPFYQ